MRKTLYLYNTKNYSFKRDGPSLLVSIRRKAPIRIPYELVDFVYLNFKDSFLDRNVLFDFATMKKPVVVSMPGSKGSLYIIPCYDGGYFLNTSQRLAIKKEVVRKDFQTYIMDKRKKLQILALKVVDKNLSIAFKERNCNTIDYEYYILNFCGKSRKKLFIVKRYLRDLFFGLITSRCLHYEIDPNEGIINEKKMMGFVRDIMSALDPITDVMAIKFLSYKQDFLWCDYKTLNEKGVKLITLIFENRKPIITKFIDKLFSEVLKIINRHEV
jgi:hypothetical protein